MLLSASRSKDFLTLLRPDAWMSRAVNFFSWIESLTSHLRCESSEPASHNSNAQRNTAPPTPIFLSILSFLTSYPECTPQWDTCHHLRLSKQPYHHLDDTHISPQYIGRRRVTPLYPSPPVFSLCSYIPSHWIVGMCSSHPPLLGAASSIREQPHLCHSLNLSVSPSLLP